MVDYYDKLTDTEFRRVFLTELWLHRLRDLYVKVEKKPAPTHNVEIIRWAIGKIDSTGIDHSQEEK